MLTAALEKQIRAALAAKIGAAAANIITEEPTIDSKHDEIDLFTKTNVDDELEVVCGKLDFLKFEDSATDGCDDNPLCTIKYRLHLFQGYKKKRSDDSTSAEDFKDLILELRNLLLKPNRMLVSPKIEHLPLRQLTDITLDNDPLMPALGYGHFADFEIKVQIS